MPLKRRGVGQPIAPVAFLVTLRLGSGRRAACGAACVLRSPAGGNGLRARAGPSHHCTASRSLPMALVRQGSADPGPQVDGQQAGRGWRGWRPLPPPHRRLRFFRRRAVLWVRVPAGCWGNGSVLRWCGEHGQRGGGWWPGWRAGARMQTAGVALRDGRWLTDKRVGSRALTWASRSLAGVCDVVYRWSGSSAAQATLVHQTPALHQCQLDLPSPALHQPRRGLECPLSPHPPPQLHCGSAVGASISPQP